jgi:hypothetical protein
MGTEEHPERRSVKSRMVCPKTAHWRCIENGSLVDVMSNSLKKSMEKHGIRSNIPTLRTTDKNGDTH